jgi:hypothetical protein
MIARAIRRRSDGIVWRRCLNGRNCRAGLPVLSCPHDANPGTARGLAEPARRGLVLRIRTGGWPELANWLSRYGAGVGVAVAAGAAWVGVAVAAGAACVGVAVASIGAAVVGVAVAAAPWVGVAVAPMSRTRKLMVTHSERTSSVPSPRARSV